MPPEPGHAFPRRALLGATGAGALAGGLVAGAAACGAPEPAGERTDVTAFGAVGDGRADDTEALQAALDAVGDRGGAVVLPPGAYRVTAPLRPSTNTLIQGTHAVGYDPSTDPASSCKLVAGGDDFAVDAGLIENRESSVARAVTLRGVALVGDRTGEALHGVRFPDEYTGEHGWLLQDVTIAGFSGDGLRGNFQVVTMTGCHVTRNAGWGINASEGGRLADAWVDRCLFYFNDSGNVLLGPPEVSGAVEFTACRIERAGNTPREPSEPVNANAPGMRLSSARLVGLTSCYTDANTGTGLEIVNEARSPEFLPNFVRVTGCHFNRDGTGDGQRPASAAGVRVSGREAAEQRPAVITFANCSVLQGPSADGDDGGAVGPRHALWIENTAEVQWLGGRLSAASEEVLRLDGVNPGVAIHALDRDLMTLPLAAPRTGGRIPEGATYFDRDEGVLRIRVGDAWRSVRMT